MFEVHIYFQKHKVPIPRDGREKKRRHSLIYFAVVDPDAPMKPLDGAVHEKYNFDRYKDYFDFKLKTMDVNTD